MATSIRDREFIFQGFSIVDQVSQSVGQQNYGGFSMTNFTNLRALNPGVSTLAEVSRVLGTLIQDLMRQP